jgi:hypothetical protein
LVGGLIESWSGSVFISSGTSLNVATIDTRSTDYGGNIFLVAPSSAVISHDSSLDSQFGNIQSGVLFAGAPTSTSTSVPGAISVTLGSNPSISGFNPGGFLTSGSGSLTINGGGDSRLVIPVAVLSGGLNLGSVSGPSAFGVGLFASTVNVSGAISNTAFTTAGGSVVIAANSTTGGTMSLQGIDVRGEPGGRIMVVVPAKQPIPASRLIGYA